MPTNNDDLVISISTDLTAIRRQLRELGQTVTQATAGYTKGFEAFGKSIDAAMTPMQKQINSMVGLPVGPKLKEWKGALAEVTTATNAHAIAAGLDTTRLMSLEHAGRGFTEMVAQGISPMKAFIMEFNNLAYAASGPGGVKAIFTEVGAWGGKAAGLAMRFPLVTAGIAAAGAAFAAYELVGGSSIKTLDELMKDHEAAIKRLGPAYDEVSKHEQKYASDAIETVNFLNAQTAKQAQAKLAGQVKEIFDPLYKSIGAGGGNQAALQTVLKSQFQPFSDAINKFAAGAASGTPDVIAFRKAVSEIGSANPNLVATAKYLDDITQAAADTQAALPGLTKPADAVAYAFGQMQEAINRIDPSKSNQRLTDVADAAKTLEDELKNGQITLSQFVSSINGIEYANPDVTSILEKIKSIGQAAADAAAKVGALNGGSINPTGKGGRVGAPTMDQLQSEYTDRLAMARRFGELSDLDTPDIPKLPKAPARPKAIPHTANDSITESIADLQGRTQELAVQRGLLGATYEEQTRVNTAYSLTSKALKDVREEARKKGVQDWQDVQLSDEQKAKIDAASEAYAQQAAALKQAREALQETSQAARDFASTFIDDMISGKSATEALGDALKQLGKRFEDLAMNELFGGGSGGGTGLFGQIFGGLFGGLGGGGGGDPWLGLRANGGPVTAGMPYIVGEKRPELFVPNQSGMIIPQVPMIQTGGGGGGTTNMNLSITVAGTGDRELMANMTAAAKVIVGQAINDNNRSLPARVAKINQNPRMR